MNTSLPQVPTLCNAKQDEVPGFYDINIVSPKDVLEGDLRRAWSSALFQTLEQTVVQKSLHGACAASGTVADSIAKAKTVCEVTISDALMSRHNVSYRIFLDSHLIDSTQMEVEVFHGTPLSEQWYLAWWENLLAGKESGYPGSVDNGRQIGLDACKDYVSAFAKRIESEGKTLPMCAVMLATPP
jgi:hypothetical protein